MSTENLNLNLNNFNAEYLLEKILSAGQDLVAEGKSQTKDIRAKGQDLAVKGEDFLVDKLNIEDNEAGRAALRKGVAAGGAAGALALLLSSRSGRKIATLGGLGALGTLAYKAHKAGKMPTSTAEVIGLLKGQKAEARSDVLLKAMISAAKADGEISAQETSFIDSYDSVSASALQEIMDMPANPKAVAALSDGPQAAAEIYAVSCRVANGLNPRERDYLDALAISLRMDPDTAARIETDVRTG